MNWLRAIVSGLRVLLQKKKNNRELDHELFQFLDASAAHHEDCGMSPAEARRAALFEMGSVAAVRQQIWESRWESAVGNFFHDLRLSIRFLLKRPAFTCVALLSLALGIGGIGGGIDTGKAGSIFASISFSGPEANSLLRSLVVASVIWHIDFWRGVC